MNTSKRKWYHWLILILVSFIFLAAGITAFTENEDAWEIFEKAGYSKEFYLLIAVINIIGAIGLWIKKLRVSSAFILILVMIGGLITQILNKDYLHCFGPLFFGILLVILIRQWNGRRL